MEKIKKKRKKWDRVQIISALLCTIFIILIIVPFWNTIVISFQTEGDYIRHPFTMWPKVFTWANYDFIFRRGSVLFTAYKGTLILTIGGTALGMTVGVMAAYGFSRSFPGKKIFFRMLVITMFFSGGLVPTFLQYKNMGLLNTYTAVIMMSLIPAYNLIVMKNGFESVPMDLQEAAMIDGAHDIHIFFKVMLPLQKPLIATFTLFSMVNFWNNWYWPMMFMNGGDKTVLQLYLKSLISNVSFEVNAAAGVATELQFSQGIKMAAVFIVMLPIMLVYPFLQKYFTKGIMVGAVKM